MCDHHVPSPRQESGCIFSNHSAMDFGSVAKCLGCNPMILMIVRVRSTSLCGILGFPFRIPPRPPPSLPIPLHCHTQHCPQSVTYPSLTQHCDTTLRRWETVLGWMGATFAWEAWHFLLLRADRICPDLPLPGRCGISTVCWLAAWGGPLGSLRALCAFDFA